MPTLRADPWNERLEEALAAGDVAFLRTIADHLLHTRNHWPADDLRERIAQALANPPVVDRRLRELPLPAQRLLHVLAVSGRPDWRLSDLVGILSALDPSPGLEALVALWNYGFLFPAERPTGKRWRPPDLMAQALDAQDPRLFVPPSVLHRSRLLSLDWPRLASLQPASPEIRESDGLEFPIRLAAAWQIVGSGSFRLTQRRDFYKREFARLRTDPLLNAPFAEGTTLPPDAGLMLMEWGTALELLAERDGVLLPGSWTGHWHADLPALLRELWLALLQMGRWCPERGWQPTREGPNPFGGVYPLALTLLTQQPEGNWLSLREMGRWLARHHPYWGREEPGEEWAEALFLGVFFPLRLVQVAPGTDEPWLVRLTNIGRWLAGERRQLPAAPDWPQTMIVQPNYEILLLRQGLTPKLIAELSRFARWQSVGAACLMKLDPDSVYHGLESGLECEDMLRLLQRHATRDLPENVATALRTWSNKRDRVLVYRDCVVVECATAADLDEALRRGLIDVKLTDRLGLVRDEERLDYRQIRLLARRDFLDPPERCIRVSEDGLELHVDAARSDLLLEVELRRFAEPVESAAGGPHYRFARPLLRQALAQGWTIGDLDRWLMQRAGQPLSPAARLLALPEESASLRLRSCLVLHVPDELTADGLLQWPATRGLIRERLGPTALVVAAEDVPRLQQRLAELGQSLAVDTDPASMAPPSDQAARASSDTKRV